MSAAIKPIAFHLPQFHPIPENDAWWGRGFTEWTSVVNAKPRFKGHYQPQLPADLGFYDLRLPEARAAQAELAAQYGIYGFCYYHYWFNGRRILERPVDEVWRSGEPDFPFCLCWANGNWTRSWDGLNEDILIEQPYSLADDREHIRHLLPIFADHRYIRIMARPLFLVYAASRMPEPQRTTEIWREETEKAGLGNPFLARVESHGESGDPIPLGFDAAIEFQPSWSIPWEGRVFRRGWWRRKKLGTAESGLHENYVYEYDEMVTKALARTVEYPRIAGVCPGWDNSPRRERRANIFVNSTPEKYEQWLAEICRRLGRELKPEDLAQNHPNSLIFINAWNEWGESAHLEPCQRWGRAYLEATKRALEAHATETVEYARR